MVSWPQIFVKCCNLYGLCNAMSHISYKITARPQVKIGSDLFSMESQTVIIADHCKRSKAMKNLGYTKNTTQLVTKRLCLSIMQL